MEKDATITKAQSPLSDKIFMFVYSFIKKQRKLLFDFYANVEADGAKYVYLLNI